MRWLWLLALAGCAHPPSRFAQMPQHLEAAPPGNVVLAVEPADAQVAVDGMMQGLGSDFDGIRGALSLSAGEHRLVVSREGYVPQSLTLYASDDGRQVVQVVLEKR